MKSHRQVLAISAELVRTSRALATEVRDTIAASHAVIATARDAVSRAHAAQRRVWSGSLRRRERGRRQETEASRRGVHTPSTLSVTLRSTARDCQRDVS
jgi:hypothetical protein